MIQSLSEGSIPPERTQNQNQYSTMWSFLTWKYPFNCELYFRTGSGWDKESGGDMGVLSDSEPRDAGGCDGGFDWSSVTTEATASRGRKYGMDITEGSLVLSSFKLLWFELQYKKRWYFYFGEYSLTRMNSDKDELCIDSYSHYHGRYVSLLYQMNMSLSNTKCILVHCA